MDIEDREQCLVCGERLGEVAALRQALAEARERIAALEKALRESSRIVEAAVSWSTRHGKGDPDDEMVAEVALENAVGAALSASLPSPVPPDLEGLVAMSKRVGLPWVMSGDGSPYDNDPRPRKITMSREDEAYNVAACNAVPSLCQRIGELERALRDQVSICVGCGGRGWTTRVYGVCKGAKDACARCAAARKALEEMR